MEKSPDPLNEGLIAAKLNGFVFIAAYAILAVGNAKRRTVMRLMRPRTTEVDEPSVS